MTTYEIKAAVDDLGSAFTAFKEANDRRLQELSKKQASDVLSEEKVNRLNGELDRLQGQVDTLTAAVKRSPLDGAGQQYSTAKLEQKAAFNRFLRTGQHDGLRTLEGKAMSIGSDIDGGYTVPDLLYEELTQTLTVLSPMRSVANIISIAGDAIDILVDNTDAGSAWVAETGARAETTTPQLQRVKITSYELYAQPRLTQQLIDDSRFNVDAFITQNIAESFAKVEGTAFTSGDGSGKPKGFLSYAAGTTWGTLERVKTGVAGGWAVSSPADILVDLTFRLKPSYMKDASWLLNRSLMADIRKFKGSDNNYLWQPSTQSGTPSTLLGFNVYLAEEMPNKATDSLSVVFGNFKVGYTIVDRQDIRILRDPFSAKPYVQFYTTKRVGGDVTNFEAIKLLQFGV
jgi:HK97 family phage major capsid protein